RRPKRIRRPLPECLLDGLNSEFRVLHRKLFRHFSRLWRHDYELPLSRLLQSVQQPRKRSPVVRVEAVADHSESADLPNQLNDPPVALTDERLLETFTLVRHGSYNSLFDGNSPRA